jgi:cytochrome P450
MQDHWIIQQDQDPSSRPAEFEVPASREDILKLALQIISSAVFGVSLPYIQTQQASKTGPKSIYEDGPVPPSGYAFTFRSAVEHMQTYFSSVLFAVRIIPSWIPRCIVKPFFGTELAAYKDTGNYLRNLIATVKGGDADGNGSDSLARLMMSSNAQTSGSKFAELTPQEVLGNLYIFTIAGHETTATTWRYALLLLALYPEKQEWVRRGIHEALEDQSKDPHDWDYLEVFPKLVTPLCVMVCCTPVETVLALSDSGN